MKPGERVTLSATPADGDDDALMVRWAQTDGPAVALSSLTGNTVTFNAPGDDFQFKFTATADDGTGVLSRAAGNHLSDPAVVTVNVIEWEDRQGGDARLCLNNEENFNAADFGIGGGPLNWDVTLSNTDAVIIEADGASIAPAGTVNGATTIRVNYNNLSADASRQNTVRIQATNPANGKSWYKRRTVNPIVFAVTSSVAPGAAPSNALGAGEWGLTFPENVTVTICAYRNGANWQAALLSVTGNYSLQARLLPGVTEVTGPGGNTTEGNYCTQINNMNSLALAGPVTWYMLAAVTAHENVHATRFLPALNHATVLPVLRTAIEALTVPHAAGMNQAAAITAIRALPAFAAALVAAQTNWLAQIVVLVTAGAGDHGDQITGTHNPTAPAYVAEMGVMNPMITAICTHARANGWAACPPRCP